MSRSTELTTDQLATLQLAADGLIGKEIAKELDLATPSVHDRLAACRKKLGAHNTVHAVAEGFRRGLLT